MHQHPKKLFPEESQAVKLDYLKWSAPESSKVNWREKIKVRITLLNQSQVKSNSSSTEHNTSSPSPKDNIKTCLQFEIWTPRQRLWNCLYVLLLTLNSFHWLFYFFLWMFFFHLEKVSKGTFTQNWKLS